jgi:hypothetical protein
MVVGVWFVPKNSAVSVGWDGPSFLQKSLDTNLDSLVY